MSGIVFATLLAGTIAWFLLPLLPALIELLRPSDAEPLTMVGQDAGDLTIFAEGFRTYLRRQFPDDASLGAAINAAQLPDGTPVVYLNGRPDALSHVASAERLISRLVIGSAPVTLPGGETFLLEIYARDVLTGGADAVYRALLGERDVHLGPRSTVLRWLHAEGDLIVDDGSALWGRASAGGTMRLGRGVRFSRVRAKRVIVGADDLPVPAVPLPVVTGSMKLPRSARQVRGFIRVEGDLVVPAGESLLGTVVVMGSLTVGSNGRLAGNVKVHGACILERNAFVDGSLVCRRDVTLSRDARVLGPVVADGEVRLNEGSVVGGPGYPASVAAATVVCGPGTQIFGAISARDEGRTIASVSGNRELDEKSRA